jgi:lysozyme family protein
MPSDAFADALPFILRWEGGFVDHPADPGGRTNKGVTQRVYDGWRRRQGLSQRDVKLIEDVEVHAIYETGYWIPPRCDLLQRQLGLVQFDTAVNMGVGRAVRFLQQSVGCGADGDFGPATESAVAACDPGDTVVQYCNTREAFYRRIVENKPSQAVFLKGWMNRLNSLRKEVGLPGFESARELDFGDEAYIARVPDIGEDPAYDF